MRNKTIGLLIGLFFGVLFASGQEKKVLFIGNSYTYYNDMPEMVKDMALSTNDTLIIDQSTPGGFRFLQHVIYAQTIGKIAAQDWDFVILQAQSQEPSWPISQVETEVYPHAKILCDSIRSRNSCARPIFYMTWGRKNGDASNCASWPPVCTYEGMDSLLSERYQEMAEDNDALVSPVGALWRNIRNNFPLIELYAADESHPSLAGSYAAACAFYVTILRKDPTFITEDAGLSASDAATIRMAAKTVVYDHMLAWNIGKYDPKSNFSYSQNLTTVDFVNLSTLGEEYTWFFGDGDSSILENPQHVYGTSGEYSVRLDASKCGFSDSFMDTVSIILNIPELIKEKNILVYPNPASSMVNIEIQGQHLNAGMVLNMYSVTGEIVKSRSLTHIQQVVSFTTTNLATGTYYLRLLDHDKVIAVKQVEIGY